MRAALPIGNGIITVNNEAQAFARARMEEQDKGGDAARAALALVAPQAPAWREALEMRARRTQSRSKEARKANKRGAARLAAVQALYQMDLAGTGLNEILAEFESHWLGGEVEGAKYRPAEAAFFRDIVGGVVREQSRLDPQIDAALARGWPLKRIEAVLRAVLRAGAYELACRARRSGARRRVGICRRRRRLRRSRTETGMVNAVLDQLAHQLRADEFDHARD